MASRSMNTRMVVCIGVVVFVSLSGGIARAQGPGMMGPGTSGFMGFEGHQIDHNLVIPQIAVGQNYGTTVSLINMADSQMMSWLPAQDLVTTGTIYFYNHDGTHMSVTVNGSGPVSQVSFTLNAAATSRLDLTSTGSDASGWALIAIDNQSTTSSLGMMDGQAMTGAMRVMASVYYTYANGSQTISRVGVSPSMYQMGLYFNSMMPVQMLGDLATGVALVNTGAQSAMIQILLKDSSGQLFSSKQIILPAGNQSAQFVNQLFSGVPANFQGFLVVQTSDEGVVMMGVLMSGGIMTSIPMLHFGQIMMAP